jgi:hypothetical protein
MSWDQCFILDEAFNVVPATYEELGEWRKRQSPHCATGIGVWLAKTRVPGHEISTVFIPSDLSWRPGSGPVCFETMVFGGEDDQYCVRAETWREAMLNHGSLSSRLANGERLEAGE